MLSNHILSKSVSFFSLKGRLFFITMWEIAKNEIVKDVKRNRDKEKRLQKNLNFFISNPCSRRMLCF